MSRTAFKNMTDEDLTIMYLQFLLQLSFKLRSFPVVFVDFSNLITEAFQTTSEEDHATSSNAATPVPVAAVQTARTRASVGRRARVAKKTNVPFICT